MWEPKIQKEKKNERTKRTSEKINGLGVKTRKDIERP